MLIISPDYRLDVPTLCELSFRRIDPQTDGDLAYFHYRDACIASFGDASTCSTRSLYLNWLAQRIEEYPDGHVMALLGQRIVGQLELQVPYGLDVGYVDLFYIARDWRRLGLGRRLNEYAERYFRAWEARRVELHVSPTNQPALQFYRSLGYRLSLIETEGGRMWRMQRWLDQRISQRIGR